MNMRGGWTTIVTACVWAAPFVIVAARSRSAVSIASAVLTVIVAVAVVVDML